MKYPSEYLTSDILKKSGMYEGGKGSSAKVVQQIQNMKTTDEPYSIISKYGREINEKICDAKINKRQIHENRRKKVGYGR